MKDIKTIPGYKDFRLACTDLSAAHFDDVCLFVRLAYSEGQTDVLARMATKVEDFTSGVTKDIAEIVEGGK